MLTLDKDFGGLPVLQGAPHHGILRLVDVAARSQAAVVMRVIELHGDELTRGAIITAQPGRLRIRAPEDMPDDSDE